MAWYLVFWRNRSTATVVPAASASQARSRAQHKQKKGYGAIVAARRAHADDTQLIRRRVWVRRRRDGSSPPVRQYSLQGQDQAAAQPLSVVAGCSWLMQPSSLRSTSARRQNKSLH
jgi:hypothetical protein